VLWRLVSWLALWYLPEPPPWTLQRFGCARSPWHETQGAEFCPVCGADCWPGWRHRKLP